MADIDSMRDLIHFEVQQAYAAEQQIDEALLDMLNDYPSTQLATDLQDVQATSQRQQARLERVFGQLNQEVKGSSASAAEAMIDQLNSIVKWKASGVVRDAALVGCAQQFIHYMVASYGTLRAHCEAEGLSESATLMDEAAEDEKRLDHFLTQRAEAEINVQASQGTPTVRY